MDRAMAGMNVKRRPVRNFMASAIIAASLLAPAMASAQVVVIANGSPITELDIRQRTKLMTLSSKTKAPATREQAIKELIDDRLKIARARTYGLEVTDAEVDAAFENMARRQRISPQQFSQVLDNGGISAAAVKARLRAEMTWSQLVRGRYGSSLQVGDADVANVLKSNNQSENTVGYVYTLYPVTVIVPNGSSPAVIDAKRQMAENLRGRFESCKAGLALARALRDVAVREPITKSTADLPEPFRDLLAKLEVGRLSSPDVTAQGLQMFALCDKKETTAESPAKRELREKIFSSRFEAESKKYLDEIRRAAMIEYK
jgi:peptidyl-prolyl cis-trans isomerase SurA